MKSKAHYKKCIELGITPVPTVVDDSCVDETVLARQVLKVLNFVIISCTSICVKIIIIVI